MEPSDVLEVTYERCFDAIDYARNLGAHATISPEDMVKLALKASWDAQEDYRKTFKAAEDVK